MSSSTLIYFNWSFAALLEHGLYSERTWIQSYKLTLNLSKFAEWVLPSLQQLEPNQYPVGFTQVRFSESYRRSLHLRLAEGQAKTSEDWTGRLLGLIGYLN